MYNVLWLDEFCVMEKEINKYIEFLQVATDRGFLPDKAKERVCEVFKLKSFSDCTDEQLDLAIFSLTRNYKKLFTQIINDKGEILPIVDDAKMVPVKIDPTKYYCKGPSHEGDAPEVELGEFCSEDCRDDYYPPKNLSKFEEFLRRK